MPALLAWPCLAQTQLGLYSIHRRGSGTPSVSTHLDSVPSLAKRGGVAAVWTERDLEHRLYDWSPQGKRERSNMITNNYPHAARDMDYKLQFSERFAYDLPRHTKLRPEAKAIIQATSEEMRKLDDQRHAILHQPDLSPKQKQQAFEHLGEEQEHVAEQGRVKALEAHQGRGGPS